MDENGILPGGERTLVHEAAHVAQFQNSGPGYIANSLLNQGLAILQGGGRNGAYYWEEDARRGVPWSDLGAEQQAMLIEDIFQRGVHDGGTYAKDGLDYTSYMLDALAQARAGRGWD